MSGIFGIFNRDGESIKPETLQTMQDAMAYWGPDGNSTWCEGPVGLGQLMLHNTPEALHERLPRWVPGADLAFTAEARVDNRDELCDLFHIPQIDRPRMPDSDLILLAYEKWGEECADHLLGDWSFAIWKPREGRLFLARDHQGNTGLYYFANERVFAFASSRKALLALPGVPRRLNELFLAQLLVSWPAYHGPTTIDLDIYRLPPAHSMAVTDDQVNVTRYWYLENTPELRLPSFEEYVEGLLEVYTEAVRCRLRSCRPVGVTLSGGLDSGSVAVLAAQALKGEGKRLSAFSSVPLYDVTSTVGATRFGDERPFAEATAGFAGNIDVTYIRAEGTSPMAGIYQTLAVHDEPVHTAGNAFWITDLLSVARQQSIGTLLTGQGGNATISWTGMPEFQSLLALARSKGWKAATRHVTPGLLLRAYRRFQASRQTLQHTAINPEFAHRLRLAQRRATARDMSNPDSWRTARDKRYAVIKPGSNFGGAFWAESGACYGMEVRDPTLDKRVLAYTLAVPDRFYIGPDGLDRWLIRQAMIGLLPDVVRLNQLRGRQAADKGQRLLASASEVEAALAEVASSDEAARYLNVDLMRDVWHNLQDNVDIRTTGQAATILLRGLMAGLFVAGAYDI